jgi:hypothetical protein
MKKFLLLSLAVLIFFVSISAIELRNEAKAYNVLAQMSLAKNCHDLESAASPELYEALGPCDEKIFLDESIMMTVRAEVSSCVVDEHFSKDDTFMLIEDADYSIVFRCSYAEQEGGYAEQETKVYYAFMEKFGSTYKIVDVGYDETKK